MITEILLIVIVLVLVAVILLLNSLVGLKNRVKNAWSQIDVQLKKRFDLIPNLVETVKGYAKHESSVFEKVAEMRSVAMGAKGPAELAVAENNLSCALKSLFAVAENYPELKANQNFAQLQSDLTDTENKIEASRRYYNGNVRDFNTKIETFPNNMIAGMLKFTKYDFFEVANAAEKENVQVKF